MDQWCVTWRDERKCTIKRKGEAEGPARGGSVVDRSAGGTCGASRPAKLQTRAMTRAVRTRFGGRSGAHRTNGVVCRPGMFPRIPVT